MSARESLQLSSKEISLLCSMHLLQKLSYRPCDNQPFPNRIQKREGKFHMKRTEYTLYPLGVKKTLLEPLRVFSL